MTGSFPVIPKKEEIEGEKESREREHSLAHTVDRGRSPHVVWMVLVLLCLRYVPGRVCAFFHAGFILAGRLHRVSAALHSQQKGLLFHSILLAAG